tara:strand:+ start:239 stop:1468 length:1230 start_codon:yes stop_codon:yes gene_type:complete
MLASILDHLRKDPDRFLGTDERWVSHRIEEYPGEFPGFPLDRILREASEDALWPDITLSPAAIRFRAEHPKLWKRDLVLDFVDFPGENVADFLGDGSFRGWSNSIASLFPDSLDPLSEEGIKEYRELLSRADTAAQIDDAASLYSNTMVEATRRGRYLTSPASLCSRIFNPGGRTPWEDFAPIPDLWGSEDAPAFSTFEERFQNYRKEKILPLERLLAEADALILPIDIGWILSGGPPLLRDQHALLSAVGGLLSRIDTLWNRISSFLGRSMTPIDDSKFPGRLRSVVLCATKIDQFRPSDRSLLEDLVRKIAEPIFRGAGLHSIQVLFTACSAIRSTTDNPDRPDYVNAYRNGEPIEVLPPKLPEEWPENWNPADFRFPRLDPRVSRHGLHPPAQIHLDRMLRSIIGS